MRDGVLFVYEDSMNADAFGSKMGMLNISLNAESKKVVDLFKNDVDKLVSENLSGRD